MTLNVALPELKHKWIKIYDTEEQRLNEEENWQDNYEECCVSVDKNSLAGDSNKEEYQYSVRTTNNDNEKKGTYYNIEIPHYWAGLEIIWGYFGWEYIDYEYNGQKLKGGNLFKKIECTTVKTIPDGLKLQHINNFLGSQNKITKIEYFDNTNIISAENLVGYINNNFYNNFRETTIYIDNWPNVINAKGMFQNAKWNINNNEVLISTIRLYIINLPNAKDCSYLFYLSSSNSNDNKYFPIIPNVEKLDYAFYNRDFTSVDVENKIKSTVTYNKCISAIGMFATTPGMYSDIDCDINFPICKDLSYFISNNFRSITHLTITAPLVENISYACSGGDGAFVINSNNLLNVKGFISNYQRMPGTGNVDLVNKYLIKHNKVICWDEYFADFKVKHDNYYYTDKYTFNISGYDQQNDVTVKNFFSNGNTKAPIAIIFIGHNKIIYDYFMNNSNSFVFYQSSNMEDGLSYIHCFENSTIYFTNEYTYGVQPLINLKDNINYSFCWQGCNIIGELNTQCAEGIIPYRTYKYLTNAIIKYLNSNFNWKQLPNVNLNFHVGEENVVNNLFDFDITDNISDFRFGEDYIGYKDFTIEEQFNYKEIKAQTINICLFRKTINYDVDTTNHNNYIINNNTFINENNIIFNLKSCPPNNVEDWQIPEDKQNEDNPHYNYEHFYIKSTSMKNLTLRGNINLYREQTVYNFIVECSGLVNFDLQWDANGSWKDRVTINNDILEGFLLRRYNGTMYIYSTKINIDNLKQSIDWWIEDNNRLNDLSIKQSVYNQLDSDYQSKLISRCSTLNLIQ